VSGLAIPVASAPRSTRGMTVGCSWRSDGSDRLPDERRHPSVLLSVMHRGVGGHHIVYPSGLATSDRTLAYSCCNTSIWASICHLKYPRHVGSWAWRRTFSPPFQ